MFKTFVRERIALYLLSFVMAAQVFIGAVNYRTGVSTEKGLKFQHEQVNRQADYFRCLIAPDEELYAKIGKVAYVQHCEKLLRSTEK